MSKLVDWWEDGGYGLSYPEEPNLPISIEEYYRWWGNMEIWWRKQGKYIYSKPGLHYWPTHRWESMEEYFIENRFEYAYPRLLEIIEE